MANSSTAGVGLCSPIGHPVTEKLTKTNFALWKVQVLPAIRGAQQMGYIDGTIPAPPLLIAGEKDGDPKVPNSKHANWLAKDQQVFSYLIGSISRDILAQVASFVSARDLWRALEEMFSS